MGSSNGPDRSRSISSTMLAGVKFRQPDAWQRLIDVWGPVIYGWCRKHGVQPASAEDIVQDVLLQVFLKVPEFERGTFRGWVSTITYRKVVDHFRSGQRHPKAAGGSSANRRIQDLADVDNNDSIDDTGVIPRADTDSLIVRRVLKVIQRDFEDHTFKAFWKTVVEGRSTADVAEDLGMTVAAIRQAKSRVLKRLRKESDGMLRYQGPV